MTETPITRSRTATKWREYLQGKYDITNENVRRKMHHDIRKRGTRMMEDLLLICRSPKLFKKDRILIFKNLNAWKNMTESDKIKARRLGRSVTVWENVSKPLVKELMNSTAVFTPEEESFEEIQLLAIGLTLFHIKYDLFLLVDDEQYRERKNVQLLSRRGVKKTLKTIRRAQRGRSRIRIARLPER